jgi:hypothetical protein
MLARSRSATLWLLLIALPLQSLAAATMLTCGPDHHGTPSLAGPAEMHDHAVLVMHCHSMDGDDAKGMSAADDHTDGHASARHPGKHPKVKCSACDACCIGGALTRSALRFDSPSTALAPDSFVPASRIGFFTDVADRPPRLSSS